jgi:undecaprenyl-diphosphatase
METIIEIFKSILLGIVEGVTEFLPVSSTGHLIIVENLIKFNGANPLYVEMYTYVIQLGAILAVVILYWKKIRDTLVNFFPQKVGYERSGFKFWLMIAVACIPGLICQLLLDDLAEKYLFNAISVAAALFIGGVLMIFAEKKLRDKNSGEKEINLTVKQALTIGAFQCLAIIPGMSRSASTIIGGWIAGLSTVAAAEFSFFLAIPVLAGMSLLKILKIGGLASLTTLEIISLAIGFVAAFLVALIVVDRFINYLKRKPMRAFAFYRMGFAVIVVLSGIAGLFH